jgi:hypothetical protein
MKRILRMLIWQAGLLAPAVYAQNPAACRELTKLEIPGVKLEIAKAEPVAATAGTQAPAQRGPTGYSGPLPAHCRVDGTIDPRIGVDGKPYGIGFAITLPDAWNRRFLFQGGGGLNGVVQAPLGAQAAGSVAALARGFAVVSTDTGHRGAGAFDAAFLKDQQANLDFSYVAIGRVAELAKQIIAKYYGRPAEHSYFAGCSTGGREGMVMSQRYPRYFDGIVSGDPAMRTGFSNLALRWISVAFSQITPKDAAGKFVPGGAFSESDRNLVVSSLLKQCDAKDGLQDGMIFNTQGCDFDPAMLRCGGAKNDSCLSAPQVDALKHAFSGPKDARGSQLYPGFPYDAGIASKGGLPGLLTSVLIPVGPPGPVTRQDVDREAIEAPNPLVDSIFTNLTTFSGHGGKLLFYHGVSDSWFSPLDTLEYYQKMAGDNGGIEKVKEWSRLYLVPGMGHCGGGDATLDSFDFLDAVVHWVEDGKAPDSVVASGRAFPGRTRPLCAYPKYAQYKGQGDPEDAHNFECRD